MSLFRRLFYRKPPDRLLEITERVYVFDCCFSSESMKEDEYKAYMDGIVAQLQSYFPDASFMVFNFSEDDKRSQISEVLLQYDITVLNYPQQFVGCPVLPLEIVHQFLRACDSWLSIGGQQNVLLMHCERGGWAVLAFMLAALLLYKKMYTEEQRTLELVYDQAPRELLHLFSPLDPQSSHLRYLSYISGRSSELESPLQDMPFNLECLVLREVPNFDGKGGCRPLVRVYGQDPLMPIDKIPKLLFSTFKTEAQVQNFSQADSLAMKLDVHCCVQGDVVLECIHVGEDLEHEEIMFRVMFNTAFLQSNSLLLDHEQIDLLWKTKDQFTDRIKAEVLFSDFDTGSDTISEPVVVDDYETECGSTEEFFEAEEIFSTPEWTDGLRGPDVMSVPTSSPLEDGSHEPVLDYLNPETEAESLVEFSSFDQDLDNISSTEQIAIMNNASLMPEIFTEKLFKLADSHDSKHDKSFDIRTSLLAEKSMFESSASKQDGGDIVDMAVEAMDTPETSDFKQDDEEIGDCNTAHKFETQIAEVKITLGNKSSEHQGNDLNGNDCIHENMNFMSSISNMADGMSYKLETNDCRRDSHTLMVDEKRKFETTNIKMDTEGNLHQSVEHLTTAEMHVLKQCVQGADVLVSDELHKLILANEEDFRLQNGTSKQESENELIGEECIQYGVSLTAGILDVDAEMSRKPEIHDCRRHADSCAINDMVVPMPLCPAQDCNLVDDSLEAGFFPVLSFKDIKMQKSDGYEEQMKSKMAPQLNLPSFNETMHVVSDINSQDKTAYEITNNTVSSPSSALTSSEAAPESPHSMTLASPTSMPSPIFSSATKLETSTTSPSVIPPPLETTAIPRVPFSPSPPSPFHTSLLTCLDSTSSPPAPHIISTPGDPLLHLPLAHAIPSPPPLPTLNFGYSVKVQPPPPPPPPLPFPSQDATTFSASSSPPPTQPSPLPPIHKTPSSPSFSSELQIKSPKKILRSRPPPSPPPPPSMHTVASSTRLPSSPHPPSYSDTLIKVPQPPLSRLIWNKSYAPPHSLPLADKFESPQDPSPPPSRDCSQSPLPQISCLKYEISTEGHSETPLIPHPPTFMVSLTMSEFVPLIVLTTPSPPLGRASFPYTLTSSCDIPSPPPPPPPRPPLHAPQITRRVPHPPPPPRSPPSCFPQTGDLILTSTSKACEEAPLQSTLTYDGAPCTPPTQAPLYVGISSPLQLPLHVATHLPIPPPPPLPQLPPAQSPPFISASFPSPLVEVVHPISLSDPLKTLPPLPPLPPLSVKSGQALPLSPSHSLIITSLPPPPPPPPLPPTKGVMSPPTISGVCKEVLCSTNFVDGHMRDAPPSSPPPQGKHDGIPPPPPLPMRYDRPPPQSFPREYGGVSSPPPPPPLYPRVQVDILSLLPSPPLPEGHERGPSLSLHLGEHPKVPPPPPPPLPRGCREVSPLKGYGILPPPPPPLGGHGGIPPPSPPHANASSPPQLPARYGVPSLSPSLEGSTRVPPSPPPPPPSYRGDLPPPPLFGGHVGAPPPLPPPGGYGGAPPPPPPLGGRAGAPPPSPPSGVYGGAPPPPPPPGGHMGTPPPPPSPSGVYGGAPPPPPPPGGRVGAPPPSPPSGVYGGAPPPPPPPGGRVGTPPPPPLPFGVYGGAPPPPPPPGGRVGTPPPPPSGVYGGAPPPPPPPGGHGVGPPPPPPPGGHRVGPPPPPPPGGHGGGPPPPPPPGGRGGALPPPPPLGHGGGPPAPPRAPGAPPPPQGGANGLTSPSLGVGRGYGLARPAGLGVSGPSSRKSLLKPLHWVKVSRAMQGSLWAELQKHADSHSTSDFDVSELETLFSAVVKKPDSSKSDGSHKSLSKSDKVHLVDLRRANNTEIMLTKIKMPLPDMMSAALTLDDSLLDADQVENLIKFCPTKEEMELLQKYTGDKENLGKCEQFFLELMKVPRVESKLRVFCFKIQFGTQISDVRHGLSTVNSACEEIRNSDKLKEIMKKILYLGNALNQGTARGSAVGFRLDSLLKLTDTRATTGKMTLMHYLCKVLASKSPDLLDFHDDLISLEAASKIQLKTLAEEQQAVVKGLEKVELELSASERDGPVSEVFCKTLKEFTAVAGADVRSITTLYTTVGKNADALALYFGEDPARCPFEQVMATLLNFVGMFRRAHADNCKQAELEKKKAQKDAEAEKIKSPMKKNAR